MTAVPSKPAPDLDTAGRKPADNAGRKVVENPGFANVGELVYCARFQPHDSRIQALMEVGTGQSGGLAIPDDINPTLQEVKPQEAIFRPRATVVPPSESPDADLVLPSLNQGSGANLYGGVAPAEDSFEKKIEAAIDRPTTPDDTHPGPRDRFRLIARIPDPSRTPRPGLVWDLFADRAAIEHEMTQVVEKNIAGERA